MPLRSMADRGLTVCGCSAGGTSADTGEALVFGVLCAVLCAELLSAAF